MRVLWKKILNWHRAFGPPPSAKPALQFSAVAMGCRLRQEIMVGWERVQNIHS